MKISSNSIQSVFSFCHTLIIICSIVLIILGIFAIIHDNKGIDNMPTLKIGIYAIFIGLFSFMITFFGCFDGLAFLQQNRHVTNTYTSLLTLICFLLIVLSCLIFYITDNDKQGFYDLIKRELSIVFQEYYNDPDKKRIIDTIQRRYQCCGIDGPEFWLKTTTTPTLLTKLPTTCCGNNLIKNCTISISSHIGCYQQFQLSLLYCLKSTGSFSIVFSIIIIICIITACITRNFNKNLIV